MINKPEFASYPEWDMKLKTIDTRFKICKKCPMMDVLCWVGSFNLSSEDFFLHFTNSSNELVLDRYVKRDQDFKPVETLPIVYNLEPLLLPFLMPYLRKGIAWLHLLVEETIYRDGRHVVKVLQPKGSGSLGYPSTEPLLDAEGKTVMKNLFTSCFNNEDKQIILTEDAYQTEELKLVMAA